MGKAWGVIVGGSIAVHLEYLNRSENINMFCERKILFDQFFVEPMWAVEKKRNRWIHYTKISRKDWKGGTSEVIVENNCLW